MKKQKPPFEHKNMLIAAGVAVLVGGGFYWYAKSSEPTIEPVTVTTRQVAAAPANNSNEPANVPAAGDTSQLKGKNILNVGPQKAGSSLIVDLVNLVKPGYVAVYSANSKGQPGTLVATSPIIKAGTSEDLVVKASLKANTAYVIELRNDDGDGKYNAAKDMILEDASGKQVMENITTSK